MTDLIVVAILVIVLGAAIRYIVKAKKSGAHCIGCSAGEGGCGCGCGGAATDKKPHGCGCENDSCGCGH